MKKALFEKGRFLEMTESKKNVKHLQRPYNRQQVGSMGGVHIYIYIYIYV